MPAKDRSQMKTSKRARMTLFDGKHNWHQKRKASQIDQLFALLDYERKSRSESLPDLPTLEARNG